MTKEISLHYDEQKILKDDGQVFPWLKTLYETLGCDPFIPFREEDIIQAEELGYWSYLSPEVMSEVKMGVTRALNLYCSHKGRYGYVDAVYNLAQGINSLYERSTPENPLSFQEVSLAIYRATSETLKEMGNAVNHFLSSPGHMNAAKMVFAIAGKPEAVLTFDSEPNELRNRLGYVAERYQLSNKNRYY